MISKHTIAVAIALIAGLVSQSFFAGIVAFIVISVIASKQPAEIQKVISRMRKEAIIVRDTPGFATSRLGLAIGLEAIRMLEDGVASAEDIDRAMELGYNHPMGPLKLTDHVGLDIRLNIAEYLFRELGSETFRPPEVLRQLVSEGKLGKKTGEGFYDWSDGRLSAVSSKQ